MQRIRQHHAALVGLSLVLLAASFALKWWYRSATADDLAFVLGPVATLVGLVSGEEWSFIPGQGYLFARLGVLIDRSCSGINFLVITTATFAFLILRRRDAGCGAPWLALLSVCAAYLLTLLANTGRILTLMYLHAMHLRFPLALHEAIGAFFFLASLIIATLLLDRSLTSRPAHATTA